MPDEARHQIIHQRPILQSEKDAIAERHARNTRDQSFIDRLNRRDPAAVRDAYYANWIRIAPTARGLADIKAWEALHPFTQRT